MNILIFDRKDLNQDGTIRIFGGKARHIKNVLGLKKGDYLKTGEKNGLMGKSLIIENLEDSLVIKPEHHETPVFDPKISLVVALPRPKVARRIIYTATTLGVKKIYFINSLRVEKSYWQSPLISEEEIEKQIISGLEQCVDTKFPVIEKRNYFKPFVEDELPEILKTCNGYLLHPYCEKRFPQSCEKGDKLLIIGPEGGFIPYENEKIEDAGAKPCKLGDRIMRVETAVTASIAKLI